MDNRLTAFLFTALTLSAQAVRFDTQILITTFPPGNYGSVIPNSKITVSGTTYTDSTATTPCPGAYQVVLLNTSACINHPDTNSNMGFWILPGTYSYTIQFPAGQIIGPFTFVTTGTPSQPQFPASIFVTTVGMLPAASSVNKDYVFLVTDGLSITDCSSGGGTTLLWCASNGSTWTGLAVGISAGVSSFKGRTGAVVPVTGDYTASQVTNAVDTTQTYANPSWITTLSPSKITGAGAAGHYLRSNSTNYVDSGIQVSDVPTLNQSTSGNAATATTATTASSLAGTPSLCTTGNAPTGILANGNATGCAPISGGTGSVTSFSAGTLSPLFTTSVATSTTTPALTFTLTSGSQNLFFATPNGSSGVGTYRAAVLADLPSSLMAGCLGAAADQIPFSSGGTSMQCSSGLTFDGTNLSVGIGSGTSGAVKLTGSTSGVASIITVDATNTASTFKLSNDATSGLYIPSTTSSTPAAGCAQFNGTSTEMTSTGAACPSGSVTFTPKSPYYFDGTNYYVAATGYQATRPSGSPTWINSVTPTSAAAGTNGDYIASGTGTYWATVSGNTSVESELSFAPINTSQSGLVGVWIYDSTNSLIWFLGQGWTSSSPGVPEVVLLKYTYSGTGNPAFSAATVFTGYNNVPHFKIVKSGGTASFQVSLNGGGNFYTLITESVGTISSGGYALSEALADIYSLVVN